MNLRPDSLTVIPHAKLEQGLAEAKPGDRFQFVRSGYFSVDPKDFKPGAPVFHRIVSLKSSFNVNAAAGTAGK